MTSLSQWKYLSIERFLFLALYGSEQFPILATPLLLPKLHSSNPKNFTMPSLDQDTPSTAMTSSVFQIQFLCSLFLMKQSMDIVIPKSWFLTPSSKLAVHRILLCCHSLKILNKIFQWDILKENFSFTAFNVIHCIQKFSKNQTRIVSFQDL